MTASLISFRKMGYALERLFKLDLALKIHGVHGNAMVDQNTANIRAKTCVQCHNNLTRSSSRQGCFISEDVELERVSRGIIKGCSTSRDEQLEYCNIDGSNLKISIWLFQAYLLNRSDINEFPTFCWKKDVK